MLNPISRIHVITTGGTIEKSYDESDGSLENRSSIIQSDIIAKLRLPYISLTYHNILAKDSLYMTDDDRKLICDQIGIRLKQGEGVLVLHGTDTMALTAKYCFERLTSPAVPVVFTGAMRPLGFENSDAYQNVVEGLYAVTHADPGFYISFHGRLFAVPNVEKNKSKGTFEQMWASQRLTLKPTT